MGRASVEGWLHLDKARELLAACGQDYGALKKAACSKDFRPVPLDAKASFHVKNALRNVASRNVVAKIPGRNAGAGDEFVVYTAHWDHLGKSAKAEGDAIYNGAVDNASGSAGLLEIARAFASLRERPRRTIVFLAVTAEEKGLLGSKWYAEHPLYPLAKTLCEINMDSLNPWGRTSDIVSVGYGQSTLDEVLVSLAAEQGRTVKPDAQPEKGSYYRSDHFEFAKVGVPALYADSGTEVVGRPPGWGLAKVDEFTAKDYHKPSDEVRPDWDLSGAVQDLCLLFHIGRHVADGDRWPEWKEGSEFKVRREAMLSSSAAR
jgi:Zn-dependent M28 family amino/carboxypeptidase